MALFKATFALYARAKVNYGPGEVGVVFVVCGLVMALLQLEIAKGYAKCLRESAQIGVGFGFLGIGLASLALSQVPLTLYVSVGLLGLGTALVTPNLAALISKRSGSGRVGAALGAQNAANSVGQVSGPLLGGALFLWRINSPYLLTAVLLVVVALLLGRNAQALQPDASWAE